MNIFFLNIKNPTEAFLDEDESRHCIKVLRHRIGDTLEGIDGKGNHYVARISEWNKKTVSVDILETHPGWGEKEGTVRLGISTLRTKDRFEWCIEKATELGVNEVFPLVCHRTVKPNTKERRIEGIVKSAIKQCKRSQLPEVSAPVAFSELIPALGDGLKLIPIMEGTQTLGQLSQQIEVEDPITILIGPEGGFTPEEIQFALDHGCVPVSLGKNRLRAETAAIHCLSAIKMIKGW